MRRFILTFLLCAATATSILAQSGRDILDPNKLKDYLKAQNFSGVVLLKSGTNEVLHMASGSGDLANEMLLTPDARFRVASITKLFTAVLIMQLVDEGKLTLDSTVASVLPEAQVYHGNKITIKHLLQHTSGLRKESKLSYIRAYTPQELIEKYARNKTSSRPGEQFKYNNIDYIILGSIIEKLTGRTFEQTLRKQVIDPLGLQNTGLDTTFERDLGITEAFEIKNGQRKSEPNAHIENIWAAGAIYSTVDDLLIFTEALKAGKLISRSAMDALFTSEARLGYVALGSWTFNSPFIAGNPRVMERRGGILGSTSVIMTHLDGPETLIVLSNTDGFDPDTFGQAGNMKEYLFKSLFSQKE